MNKGGDRGGTLHGIRQPHMERDLGGFPHRTEEEKEANEGHHGDFPTPADSAK